MRVLHILNDVTKRGNGIVNAAVDLAIEQVRAGDEVALAAARGGYQELLTASGVKCLPLDQTLQPLNLCRALRRLHKSLREFRPDVVHAHMRTGLLLALCLKPFHRFALVGHLHNVHDRLSLLMGFADRVIAVSSSVAETLQAFKIPRRKIRVVLNGPLGSRRVPGATSIQPAVLSHPAIVTVCGMSERKGIEELLVAFDLVARHCPDAHIYLVGDGPEYARFMKQARKSANAERIHFEGYQEFPQAYMLGADIFVLASRRESFGLVLIEAREAGCAVVATNVDGIPEALDEGRAGVLVPSRDPVALSIEIRRIIEDEERKAELQRCAKRGISCFTVEAMAKRMQLVYAEIASTRNELHRSDSAGRSSDAALSELHVDDNRLIGDMKR